MSYTKVTFVGLNVSNLLNYLCKEGLQLQQVTKDGQNWCITVSYRESKRLLQLLKQWGYNVTRVQNLGGIANFVFAKRHFVLLIAIVAMVVGCALLSNYCCKIVVTGDVAPQVVLEQMSKLQVQVGTNLRTLNIDHLENALAVNLEVTYAVVTRRGGVLYVQTVAKRLTDNPIDMHKRRDIVATCDGIVESVLCEQGTPIVKVGDCVKTGDVLIQGLRRFNDGTTQDVYAMGRVVVVQSVSGFAPYTGTITQLQPTGNKQTFTQVVLFGKVYGKTCNFTHYQVETQTTYLHPLNLEVQQVTYHQMAFVTVNATLDDCLHQLTEQSLQLALLRCNFAVTNTQFVTTQSGVTAILQGRSVIT